VKIKRETTEIKTTVADITTLAVDAVVNAANSSLMGGGGVDGAIHRAGGPAIVEECKKIIARTGRLPTGEAVLATAGNMPSKYVIHTVGPVWHGGKRKEPEFLRNCYQNSLTIAKKHKLKTIAFPSISTGIYGYPIHEAAQVAVKAVIDWVAKNPGALDEIIFCGYDPHTEKAYAEELQNYISMLR